MICKKCGREIPDNVAFCRYCGEKAAVPLYTYDKDMNIHEAGSTGENVEKAEKKEEKPSYCIYCGAKMGPGAKFCSKCGKPVDDDDVRSGNEHEKAKYANTAGASGAQKTYGERPPQHHTGAQKAPAAIGDSSMIITWTCRICAAVAVLGMIVMLFQPMINYVFGVMTPMELMTLSELGDDSASIKAIAVFVCLIHLGICAAVFFKPGRCTATIGLAMAVIVRFVPNMIASMIIRNELGYDFGYEFIQYGAGWWLIFLSFLAAAAVAWFFVLRERREK